MSIAEKYFQANHIRLIGGKVQYADDERVANIIKIARLEGMIEALAI